MVKLSKNKSRKLIKRQNIKTKSNISKKSKINNKKQSQKNGGARGQITSSTSVLPPLLEDNFMDEMFKNMWTFMNPEMMMSVFNQSGCNVDFKYKKQVEDDNWTDDDYRNSIVFKGKRSGGHYVYIDPNNNVFGTYECDILTSIEDDGICHGFAIAAALNNCGWNVGQIILNPLPAQKPINYNTIMNAYKIILQEGWWDNALHEHFYYDVQWLPRLKKYGNIKTKESLKAFELLNNLNL